jgi:hypothetical protein
MAPLRVGHTGSVCVRLATTLSCNSSLQVHAATQGAGMGGGRGVDLTVAIYSWGGHVELFPTLDFAKISKHNR